MTSALGSTASLAARAGGTVVRQIRSVLDPAAASAGRTAAPASGWLAVTVLRGPSDVDTGKAVRRSESAAMVGASMNVLLAD